MSRAPVRESQDYSVESERLVLKAVCGTDRSLTIYRDLRVGSQVRMDFWGACEGVRKECDIRLGMDLGLVLSLWWWKLPG